MVNLVDDLNEVVIQRSQLEFIIELKDSFEEVKDYISEQFFGDTTPTTVKTPEGRVISASGLTRVLASTKLLSLMLNLDTLEVELLPEINKEKRKEAKARIKN